MGHSEVKPKHEVNRRDDSDGGREGQNAPSKERASQNADVGSAPEQGGTRRDADATYEPDKKPSRRETM